jgi:hypothetical protein
MKVLTAIFTAAVVLYFLDSTYSDAQYQHALTEVVRNLSAALGFHW